MAAAASASSNPSPSLAVGFGGILNKGGSSSISISSGTFSGDFSGTSTGTSPSGNGSPSTTPTTVFGSGSGSNPSASEGGPTTSSANSQQTTSSGQPSSHNNGWIAGVVIGAVAGLAIIIGVGYWIWYLHRRLAQSQKQQSPTEQTQLPPPKDESVQPASLVQVHELPTTMGVEMPAGNQLPELRG
jgi:hypothetical protein